MDEKEIKIVLTEANFSQAVKVGRIIYILNQQGQKLELPLTSMDVRELCKGKILMRKVDEYFVQVVLATIDKEMIHKGFI